MDDTSSYIADLYRLWGSNKVSITNIEKKLRGQSRNVLLLMLACAGLCHVVKKQQRKIDNLTKSVDGLKELKED